MQGFLTCQKSVSFLTKQNSLRPTFVYPYSRQANTLSAHCSPPCGGVQNPALQILQRFYHRLTRANTPDSVSFRRFLPFSPWRAPARLRLKKQKSLENPLLTGAPQFCRTEMCPDKKRPAENTCRIVKGLDVVWAHFCPSKPCLPLSIDGNRRLNNTTKRGGTSK